MPAKRTKVAKVAVAGESTPAAVLPPVDPLPEEIPTLPPIHLDVTEETGGHNPHKPWTNWPENTETRILVTKFDDATLAGIAISMGEKIQDRAGLRVKKSNDAKRVQSQIDDIDAELERLASVLEAGGDEAKVPCHWVYETSGRDESTGLLIAHPDQKTLLRSDTSEVVAVERITFEERHMGLDLGDSYSGTPGAGEDTDPPVPDDVTLDPVDEQDELPLVDPITDPEPDPVEPSEEWTVPEIPA